MSRRVRTLLVGGVLFVVLFVLSLTLSVPYVILSPGPTYNTLGKDDSGNEIIVIDGRTPNPTSGHLNMTTVNVSTQSLSVFSALNGWLMHDEVVVPRSSVIPPGQSQQQIDQQNTAEFAQSQDSATIAALCELGYPQGFGVVSVEKGSPADGKLKSGDEFVTVAGKPADTSEKLSAIVQTLTPGTPVEVVVTRQGSGGAGTVTTTVTPRAAPDGGKGARFGITVSTTCLAPFSVDLGLGNQIGGPSAGLMFALGIMDKVGNRDLTKGMFVAGTGTIDATGKVGPIGGIQLKMIAAKKAGATVFLAPAGNCDDVRKDTPDGLDVVKVSTLHEAVQDLLAVQKGQPVPHC